MSKMEKNQKNKSISIRVERGDVLTRSKVSQLSASVHQLQTIHSVTAHTLSHE
jgi:hypothetical protein